MVIFKFQSLLDVCNSTGVARSVGLDNNWLEPMRFLFSLSYSLSGYCTKDRSAISTFQDLFKSILDCIWFDRFYLQSKSKQFNFKMFCISFVKVVCINCHFICNCYVSAKLQHQWTLIGSQCLTVVFPQLTECYLEYFTETDKELEK